MRKAFTCLVGGLFVYEYLALRNECEGDTISEIVWAATTRRPLVPFGFGLLCGHFFWQRAERAPRRFADREVLRLLEELTAEPEELAGGRHGGRAAPPTAP